MSPAGLYPQTPIVPPRGSFRVEGLLPSPLEKYNIGERKNTASKKKKKKKKEEVLVANGARQACRQASASSFHPFLFCRLWSRLRRAVMLLSVYPGL